MARKISLWFARVGVWLFFCFRFYYKLSRLYQKMQLTWANKGATLPVINDIQQLEDLLSRMKWRKDTIRQWFDTFEHPKAIWIKYLAHPEKGVEDCDGFAIFGANRIQDMIKRGQDLWPGAVPIRTCILTVAYRRAKQYGGHNVCLVVYADAETNAVHWGYIGNWYSGKFQGGFKSAWPIICGIAGGDIVGWAAATPQMKLIKHGWREQRIAIP